MDTIIAGQRQVTDLRLSLLGWDKTKGSAIWRGKPVTVELTETYKEGRETELFYKIVSGGKVIATVEHWVSFRAGSVLHQTTWIESACDLPPVGQ
jgi:hypothetical protein